MTVMGENTITMSKKEVRRFAVIQRLIDQQITTQEAATLLNLSPRQVYRLKARVLQEGEERVLHKNRGRKPAHALWKTCVAP
jgi:transposase